MLVTRTLADRGQARMDADYCRFFLRGDMFRFAEAIPAPIIFCAIGFWMTFTAMSLLFPSEGINVGRQQVK